MNFEDNEQSSPPVLLDYATQEKLSDDSARSFWSIIGTIATYIFAVIVFAGLIYLLAFLYLFINMAP